VEAACSAGVVAVVQSCRKARSCCRPVAACRAASRSTSAPGALVVALPFDLKAEPLPVKLLPGAKATLKVTATRKGGYAGPITVEVQKLPANVTAAKGTIAMGQTAVDVEITAAANAVAGDKADVSVLGTATAAGNQTAATPNFTVSVGKK